MGLAFWKRDLHDLEILFEDDFLRPDSKNLGSGWLDKGQDVRIEKKALRVGGGWLAGSAEVPGGVRLEFEVETVPPARINLGGFVSGAEGFWNGYNFSLDSEGRAVLLRSSVAMASAGGLPLKSGKKIKVYLQRLGGRVTLGLDGRKVLEFVDLEPYSDEVNSKFGVWAYSTEARFSHLKVYRVLAREKLGPLSVGDRLFQRRMVEGALSQYRNALPVLNEDEKEVCGLKIGLCLLRLGRASEALDWLDQVALWEMSPAGRSRHGRLLFEAAIPAQSMSHFRAILERTFSEAGSAAERQSLVTILARLDTLWKNRGLWGPGDSEKDLGVLLSHRDALGAQSGPRTLMKFGYLHGGEEGYRKASDMLVARTPISTLALNLKGEIQRPLSEMYYLHRSDGQEALKKWEENKNISVVGASDGAWGLGYSTPAMDELYGGDGARMVRWVEETIKVKNGLNDAFLFTPMADYLWARGDEAKASDLYAKIRGTFPLHGSASCSALLALSAMAAWRGEDQRAEGYAKEVITHFPAESWVSSLARFASGACSAEEYTNDPLKDAFWLQFPSRILPLLAAAARGRALGDMAFVKDHLEMIRGISFPWEPSYKVADRYLKTLGGS